MAIKILRRTEWMEPLINTREHRVCHVDNNFVGSRDPLTSRHPLKVEAQFGRRDTHSLTWRV